MSVKLQAGQWYRTALRDIGFCVGEGPRNGSVVNDKYIMLVAFRCSDDFQWFTIEGKSADGETYDIIEHLPDCTGFDWVPPQPPQPKYRPFKSAEEFKPYRNCWWYRDDSDGRKHFPPMYYSDRFHGGISFAYRFETCFFEDGSPFGVLQDE